LRLYKQHQEAHITRVFLYFRCNLQFTNQNKEVRCLNKIGLETYLSQRQNPLSLRVGTVCWGFIWNSINNIYLIYENILSAHM